MKNKSAYLTLNKTSDVAFYQNQIRMLFEMIKSGKSTFNREADLKRKEYLIKNQNDAVDLLEKIVKDYAYFQAPYEEEIKSIHLEFENIIKKNKEVFAEANRQSPVEVIVWYFKNQLDKMKSQPPTKKSKKINQETRIKNLIWMQFSVLGLTKLPNLNSDFRLEKNNSMESFTIDDELSKMIKNILKKRKPRS